MVFQILDDKRDCRGIYADGEFIYDEVPDHADHTWAYSDFLRDKNIQYGYLWSLGKSLREACPGHLKQRLDTTENKIKSHFKAFSLAKINFEDVCFYFCGGDEFFLFG